MVAPGPGNTLPPLTGPGNIALTTVMASSPAISVVSQTPSQQQLPLAQTQPAAMDTMRAYRACLNCRTRKSKCDLELNRGRPPCRRCQREAKECVLGESHRGGRRVRKKLKLDNNNPNSENSNPNFKSASSTPATSSQPGHPSLAGQTPIQSPRITQYPPPPPQFTTQYNPQVHSVYTWSQPATQINRVNSNAMGPRNVEQTTPINPAIHPTFHQRAESTVDFLGKPEERNVVHESIASVDLQNPSDALNLLARVAERADDGDSPTSDEQSKQNQPKVVAHSQDPNPPNPGEFFFHYQPMVESKINSAMIYQLFSTFEEFFHPFFPITPRENFDRSRLPWMSRYEPHLFSAILTVASKDNEQVHQVCSAYNQQLVSKILAGADANVEAVEALLLLSQWVSHHPQASISVGRGEEDRIAWMYIGTALRLGYYLGIDRTAFKSDLYEDLAVFNRKRLVWSACYICDRQVSVRLGKGFWARGPGPLSGLKSSDYPTLQPTSPNADNWAVIFQANLELTQIFSNVHDILYSSKGHGWKEMLEGRYAKYLDDFRTSIRSWNDTWGNLRCSGPLKASLRLTFNYLRLYVNAFAYQATISRALTSKRDSQHNPNRPVPLINASAPDARFIYEALDAAKSLLSIFNNFGDLETLRYMPSPYYLFIIYSAVFLYKARSTTTMTEEERVELRQLINQTILRLNEAGVGSNHMGSRYARLLQLLWRKAPKRNAPNENNSVPHNNAAIDPRLNTSFHSTNPQNAASTSYDQTPFPGHLPRLKNNPNLRNTNFAPRPSGTFSWLDLGATWNFATQNNCGTGSQGDSDNDMMMDGSGGPFDVGDISLLTDYSLLEGDNPNLIF